MMKEAIKIGLLGSGTVGSGVVRVLRENMEEITARVGTRLVLAKVLVRDVKKPRPYLEGVELTDTCCARSPRARMS
jgi:homoserine dehydrogenase